MSDSIKSNPTRKTHSLTPENKETPISFVQTDVTSAKFFYLRNHFSYPSFTYQNHWLSISGLVDIPMLFSMQDIRKLPSKKIKVVLECAGNKRSLFQPKVFGEQWEKGGMSHGYWKGVSLLTLLQMTGIKKEVKEVIFESHDMGTQPSTDQPLPYSRSLPLNKAIHPDTILAYEYNNEPIPYKHGFPLRLIVPNWYGMASIKWLKHIKLADKEFGGHFQTKDYVFYPHVNNDNDSFPVTVQNVNSSIQQPTDLQILSTGKIQITGIAWTGKGYISKVEISTDGGITWSNALLKKKESYGWVSWSFEWVVWQTGEYTLLSKATDSHGRVQPESPFWNRKGYGYNATDRVSVKIE
ncbi:sulfite oxidase [Halalkalibacter akibai]|uniref:Possible sulfite oxidase n=1 Tax=Halalkalibacter akibai (strain ATCC 43226 / DSM 21942 / CIP 109018 / JCM 9157 / 1139) TaxID=1236973 RepID=W4QQW8_HALA3|nr:sulfite oxidase [Halalkalibacter akibai]GAE34485.1 possible sulfite oxidase [Halalkalibacter akibai JCM 9157]